MTILLGQTLATYAISQAMKAKPFYQFVQSALNRHHSGDWGDCCEEDRKINDESAKSGMRILSVYNIPDTVQSLTQQSNSKIWIITEANRMATTVLFPSEY